MDISRLLDSEQCLAYIVGRLTATDDQAVHELIIIAVGRAVQERYKVPDWLLEWAGDRATELMALDDATVIESHELF